MQDTQLDSKSIEVLSIYDFPEPENLPEGYKDEDDLKAENQGYYSWGWIKIYIIIAILIFILGIALLVLLTGKAFIVLILEKIETFASNPSPSTYAFFIGMQVVYSWLLLPGLSYFNIAMGFFLKNFFIAWAIATFGAWISA